MTHLRCVLKAYASYYNEGRTHLSGAARRYGCLRHHRHCPNSKLAGSVISSNAMPCRSRPSVRLSAGILKPPMNPCRLSFEKGQPPPPGGAIGGRQPRRSTHGLIYAFDTTATNLKTPDFSRAFGVFSRHKTRLWPDHSKADEAGVVMQWTLAA